MAAAYKSNPTKPRKPRSRKSDLNLLEASQPKGLGLEDAFVENEDGSIEIDLDRLEGGEDEAEAMVISHDSDNFYGNLVDLIAPGELLKIGMDVRASAEADEQSRYEWKDMIEMGSNLLGLKLEEKQDPFPGACSAHHPLLMESAVKFQSKASNELLPANGPVKGKIMGELTLEKEAQANRVAAHMNYQLTEEMTEFYSDSERMLLYLALFGSAFKKVYWSEYLERPVSEFVPADQLIVSNNAADLYRCERYTHVITKTKLELEADCASGLYQKSDDFTGVAQSIEVNEIKQALNSVSGIDVTIGDSNAGYTLLEQHVSMYIEELDDGFSKTGYELGSPYIITVDKATGDVLGIRRNWKEGDAKRRKKCSFIHYLFVPSFGFYGFGFLHLLGNLQLSLTSSLRSLVDAGQFANLQGGFKLKGVRIIDTGRPISPGEFREIDTSVLDINKSIMKLPFGEPSNVLFQMLNFLDAKGQKFADATESIIGDATNYGPVGTTLALLDASTKFFSAIHKRLHNSLKQELKILADLNGQYLPDDLKYNIEAATMAISRKDYSDAIDVIPVSDPNISSNAHRMAKAQTILQVAQTSPEMHDMRQVLKHFYTAMDYENIDKILPPPEEAQPQDPMSDIQLAVQGKPIKAFEGQQHQAHMAIKGAFLQDPLSGKNPTMQKAAAAIQANIQEHMLLQFMEQMKAIEGQGATPEQAAQQVAIQNQKQLEAQLKAAEGQNQDQAAMLLANAELLDSKVAARKQLFDEKFKVADLELKKEELDMKLLTEARRTEELNQKFMHDTKKLVMTKALDSMIEGMRPPKQPKETTKEKPKNGKEE